MIKFEHHGAIAELTIQHSKLQNPFTREMTRQLIGICGDVEADDRVSGALLWGGEGRSFSVGGDFNEVQDLTAEQVREYLVEIVESYQAVLAISKPVVVAVDHHAIGQGLQVALMGDWLVGSERSSYHMPELKGGVPCPLGSAILESLLGRAAMLELVIGCERLAAEDARCRRLINQVVHHEQLHEVAMERLHAFMQYPAQPYRLTKKIHNGRLARALAGVVHAAAEAHAACFASGSGQKHFARILGRAGER